MLSAKASQQSMFLTAIGMSFTDHGDKQLALEGAAKLLWELFIKNAQ